MVQINRRSVVQDATNWKAASMTTAKRKLFVTGGAGFIGSAFIRHVLSESESYEITNFDALTYAGNPDNLVNLDPKRHQFVRGDIAARAAVLPLSVHTGTR
jgi:dTDP-glucose 4,6-dehydratase